MLVRITQRCQMQCPHCMVDAKPDGEHMTMETFKKVVVFISQNTLPIVLISGGEPTEHPQIREILRISKDNFKFIILISNGTFLKDLELRDYIISLGISVQITNDPRFYKTKIEKFEHSLFSYEENLKSNNKIGQSN